MSWIEDRNEMAFKNAERKWEELPDDYDDNYDDDYDDDAELGCEDEGSECEGGDDDC